MTAAEPVTDPVCGMKLKPEAAAATIEQGGKTYFFCSERCAARFRANPGAYGVGPEAAPRPPRPQ